MKIVKRLVSILLVACLLAPVCSFATTQPEARMPDGTPPVLHSVSISASEVSAPGELTVTIRASDDVSGVRYASGVFENPENNRSISANFYIDNESNLDGEFTGTAKVSKYEPSGDFKLTAITISDVAGNYSYYSLTSSHVLPNELSFTVVNDGGGEEPEEPENPEPPDEEPEYPSTPDDIPPTLHEIGVTPLEATAPGEVTFSARITDDVSGLWEYTATFINPKNQQLLDVSFYADIPEFPNNIGELDGTFSAKMEIDRYQPSGVRNLVQVMVKDVAGNEVIYRSKDYPLEGSLSLPNEVSFTISKKLEPGTPDITPPTLHSVSMNLSQVPASGEFTVDASISDDVSGISYANVSFVNPQNKHSISGQFDITSVGSPGEEYIPPLDGVFTATVDVSKYEPSGKFILNHIQVGDDAGNYIDYYSKDYPQQGCPTLPSELSINVINDGDGGIPEEPEEPEEPSRPSQSNSDDSYNEHWDDVSRKIKKQSEIKVKVSAGDDVPSYIFTEIYGKDITITISQKGQDDLVINGKNMHPIERNRIAYSIENLRELYETKPANADVGKIQNSYSSFSIERGAHDLVMLHMGKLSLSENEYAAYYLKNYETLYSKFYVQLTDLSK